MSARDAALAAWAAVPKVEDPAEARRLQDEEEQRLRHVRGERVLAASPLAEWFPGEEWDVMGYGRPGTSEQFHGDGLMLYVSPADRSFTLWLDGSGGLPGVVRVQYVRWVPPRPVDSEGYWHGIAVDGPAAIGALIQKDDEYDREREARGERPRKRTR